MSKIMHNFLEYQTDIMIEALQFTSKKVRDYYEDAIKREGELHRASISAKREEICDELDIAIDFLTQNRNRRTVLIHTDSPRVFTVIRSALEVYSREISKIAEKYSITGYSKKKNEIGEILKADIFKDSQTGLFDKYYEARIGANGKVEFFISYSIEDKNIAGKIRDILVNHDFDAFFAHRDIPLSEEWRKDILKHLESCSILLAICTSNYEYSAWGNQEVGIAFEKGRKIIPLFKQGTNKSRFGFLEAIQGAPNDFTEDNLDKIVTEVIEKIIP